MSDGRGCQGIPGNKNCRTPPHRQSHEPSLPLPSSIPFLLNGLCHILIFSQNSHFTFNSGNSEPLAVECRSDRESTSMKAQWRRGSERTSLKPRPQAPLPGRLLVRGPLPLIPSLSIIFHMDFVNTVPKFRGWAVICVSVWAHFLCSVWAQFWCLAVRLHRRFYLFLNNSLPTTRPLLSISLRAGL